ncbi:thioredoxin TrxC [Vibrio sonorensis]|uniref:thioredoxin TrxC n=1 Tax=Vibrio sonorensis TaxID=1004316 RepID=UPI0008DA877A|nr:thioredoxin TrxC [Vibrio sonorensis]
MSTFNSRCPHCGGVNRVPTERVCESPSCGKCQEPLLDGKPIEGTSLNYHAILKSDLPIVIDFWAPWCNPCVGFAPVFEDVAANFKGQVRFVKINTEVEQQLASEHQIRSIPTVKVLKNGQLLDVINGALPKSQFEQWLRSALSK